MIPAEHRFYIFNLQYMIKGLKRFCLVTTLIKKTSGMREKLRKLVIEISVFQLIAKFHQILILIVLRLIQYFSDNFFEEAQVLLVM